jgi:hypothetical protein
MDAGLHNTSQANRDHRGSWAVIVVPRPVALSIVQVLDAAAHAGQPVASLGCVGSNPVPSSCTRSTTWLSW